MAPTRTRHVKAISAFFLSNSRIVEVDEVVEVHPALAQELVTAHKAVVVDPPAPAAPAAAAPPQAPEPKPTLTTSNAPTAKPNAKA
jgi:hypothetical protein